MFADSMSAWQPMSTLPDDGGPSSSPKMTVLAITADGRVMQMPPWMLRDVAKTRTPEHLRFPAVGWMHIPPLAPAREEPSRPQNGFDY